MEYNTSIIHTDNLYSHAIDIEPKTDREIIDAIRSGNEYAFDLLVKKYQSKVYLHCLRIVGDREESMDLTQEVFIKVNNSINKYEHDYAFYTWLYRITYNTCVDYLRKLKSKSNILSPYQAENWDDSVVANDQSVSDGQCSPENYMLNMELQEILNNAINRLSDKLRWTILLKEVKGHSYEKIAEICGCSIGTVKSRINRARKQMKTNLIPYLAA